MTEKPDPPVDDETRARQCRYAKMYQSYTTLLGEHRPFELINLLPARAGGYVQLAVRRDIERELTDKYLHDRLFNILGTPPASSICSEIRARCCTGIEAIVRARIDEKRRGQKHDRRLQSLQTNLSRVEKALKQLTKGEIDSVTDALDRIYGKAAGRQPFIFLNSSAEFLFLGEMRKEALPPRLITDASFRTEATQQYQHPMEFWPETLFRLTVVAQKWVRSATENPTARDQAGRPSDAALRALSEGLCLVYEGLDQPDKNSHRRFGKFLDIILGPLIPREHRPSGSFKSLATTTRQRPAASKI
jgi:hypothetical protein